MSAKNYIEWYNHNLSEKRFRSVSDCYADLLKMRNNSLQENDTITGNKAYKPGHELHGWKIVTSDTWKNNQFWASQKKIKVFSKTQSK